MTAMLKPQEPSRARVLAVSRKATRSISKRPQPSIVLRSGLGVQDDVHCGKTIRHRSRMAKDPSLPNLRQVHLLHCELFAELATKGFEIEPAQMGENITTQGIPLLELPRGSRLRIGPEAIVELTGLRNPCAQLEQVATGLMGAVLERTVDGSLVRKAGVMAVVVSDGVVTPGDRIEVEIPKTCEPLEPV